MSKKTEIMIVAGEASGDLHGAALINALLKRHPDVSFFGIGGQEMEEAGAELLFHVRDLGVTGFTEVIGKLGTVIRTLNGITRAALDRQPISAILIDYPDFNLRLARRLHRAGIRVIYYVSPQMWAWRSGRVNIVRKYVDQMLVLFPFEEKWYKERGASARFVGNPVLDRVAELPDREQARKLLNMDPDAKYIAIMPGSRVNEVKRMLPVMVEAIPGIKKIHPDIRFILPVAATLDRAFLETFIGERSLDIQFIEKKPLVSIRAVDFAWVTSGTATLETALAGTPLVVGYRTSWLSYKLARLLVKVPYISISNLVAEKELAKELIQDMFTPEAIIAETVRFFDDPNTRESMLMELSSLQKKLGSFGAADRAANEILAVSGLVPEK